MSSLAHTLFSSSSERLQSIAAFWQIDASSNPAKTLPSFLFLQMVSPWHLRRVYQNLPDEERIILDVLASRQKTWQTIDQLSYESRLDKKSLGRALRDLSKMAIVETRKVKLRNGRIIEGLARKDAKSGLPEEWIVEFHTELHSALRLMKRQMSLGESHVRDLRRYLSTLDLRSLQVLAKNWEIDRSHELGKKDLTELLWEMMTNQRQINKILSSATPQAQAIFRQVLEDGGKTGLGKVELWSEKSGGYKYVEELSMLALVFDVFSDGNWFLMIPADMLPVLHAQNRTEDSSQLPKGMVTEKTREPEFFLNWAILAVISYLEQRSVRLTVYEKALPAGVLEGIKPILGLNSKSRQADLFLDFVFHILFTLGILERKEGRLGIANVVEEWARLTFLEQISRITKNWINDRVWSEPELGGRKLWDFDHNPIRTKILEYIPEWCIDHDWYEVSSFGAKLIESEPSLLQLVTPSSTSRWKRGSSSPESDRKTALQLLIKSVVIFPLRWLGIVDIESEGKDKSTFFRLSNIGAHVLRGSMEGLRGDTRAENLLVQANMAIFPSSNNGPLSYRLRKFADLTQAGSTKEFMLTQQSVLRAVEHGLKVDEILGFLSEHSSEAIPQNVTVAVNRWSLAYKPVSISKAILLEVQSESILKEILRLNEFSEVIEKVIGPRIALLKQGIEPETLLEDLRKRGFSPSTGRFDNHQGLE